MANNLVKGIGWTSAGSLCRNLTMLIQIAVLTRFLSKEEFGLIAIAHVFVAFTQLFLDMGMSAGILHKRNITKNEYSSLFFLNIIFGVLLTCLLYGLAPMLTKNYHSQDLTLVVRLLCFTILISAFGTQQRTFCQKIMNFKRMAIIEIVSSLVTLVVAIVTAIMGFGVYSLAYSTLAGTLLNNAVHIVLGLSKDARLSFHFSLKETIPFFKIGCYSVGAQVLDFFSREIDVVIISSTLGLEFLGVYNIAKRLPAQVYGFISPIISRVLTPMFANINHDLKLLRSKYLLATRVLSWFSFPLYMLIAALAPTIVYIVFGEKFVDGSLVLSIFALMYAFNAINSQCGSIQVALGRTDIGLYWTVYRVASTVIIYWIGAQFGETVFLIAILCHIILNVWVVWLMQFRPMVKITLKEYTGTFAYPFIISVVLSVCAGLIYYAPSIIYSMITTIVFALSYVLILKHTSELAHIKVLFTNLNIHKKYQIFKYCKL